MLPQKQRSYPDVGNGSLGIQKQRDAATQENTIYYLSWTAYLYRTNSRIARSSPSKVSGYMRPPISWRTIWIE